MNPSRAHTVALVRLLQQTPLPRARKRSGRLPPQLQPDHIRLGYYRALLPTCEDARAAFLRELPQILHAHRAWYRETYPTGKRDGARLDASPKRAALAAIDRAQATFLDNLRPHELDAVAQEFGKRTTDFQKAQLDKQVRAAIGVPYSSIEKPTRDLVPGWAALNVDLIKTVPERYFDRLRQDVELAYETGMATDTLVEKFEDDYGIQEDDAARIARDQIGKINGMVNQDRQQALGVERFIWRGMNDQRERPEHVEFEAQSTEEPFTWDDPPIDENGEQVIPGSPIQCRCYAEPVLADILGEEYQAPDE